MCGETRTDVFDFFEVVVVGFEVWEVVLTFVEAGFFVLWSYYR